MYPVVTFWWLKACCERGKLLHPCEAALFVPRPNAGGCPDFKGKVVAFAGLSKAPAAFEQYMKEAVLVLGCSWSGEMHQGVHVLINCCPPLQDNDKITWTCVVSAQFMPSFYSFKRRAQLPSCCGYPRRHSEVAGCCALGLLNILIIMHSLNFV